MRYGVLFMGGGPKRMKSNFGSTHLNKIWLNHVTAKTREFLLETKIT